jgi:hypothetical protein
MLSKDILQKKELIQPCHYTLGLSIFKFYLDGLLEGHKQKKDQTISAFFPKIKNLYRSFKKKEQFHVGFLNGGMIDWIEKTSCCLASLFDILRITKWIRHFLSADLLRKTPQTRQK